MKFHLIYIFLAITLTSCNMKNQNSHQFHHKNGLIVSIPGKVYNVEEQPQGFLFSLSPQDHRQVNSLQVKLIDSIPNKIDQSKTLHDIEYHYDEDIYHGGSGGAEYSIKIWKPCNGQNFVQIEYFHQTDGIDKFELAWATAKSISCE